MVKPASTLISTELAVMEQSATLTISVAEIIAKLEGVQLTRKQLIAIANIGSSMSRFDAAFDEPPAGIALDNGRILSSGLTGGIGEDSTDPYLARGLQIARDNLDPRALDVLGALTMAQIDSIDQRRILGREAVIEITRRKGGLTLLLLAVEVKPDISLEQRSCYRELGYLVQLLDDLIDRNIDERDGICTLATLSECNTDLLQVIFEQYKRVREVFSQYYKPEKLHNLFQHIDSLMLRSGLSLRSLRIH